MTTIENDGKIADLSEYAEQRRMSFEEVMSEKYSIVGAEHDPAHGSYVILADRNPNLAPGTATSEMGYASPSPWTSWTREERVPELMDRRGLRTYYDMKRADGTVRGALRLLKTPVMGARWFVEAATDSTVDKNIAAFVQKNLMEELSVPWSRVVEDALLMCDFGYMPFEKVFVQKDGKIKLAKLAPRHPMDINEWLWDDNGGPDGIVMDPVSIPGTFRSFSNYQREALNQPEVFIPIAKLVVFVLEQEAGDLRGISILRSAYKHYFYKDCKSEDTEILSQRGWLTHNQLTQADKVLTINPETGMSEWNDVQYIKRYPGVHDVIKMESQQISSISTPDHRWLVKDATWKSPYEFITTENLKQRHIIPRAALSADTPTDAKYTDDLVELVGWFITEGSWQGSGSAIAQNYDQPFFSRIRACLTGMFGPAYQSHKDNIGRQHMPPGWCEYTKKHDPNGCQFRLNAAATKVLKEFVKDSNKVLTNEFILSLTKAQLELFVTTCLRADGCGMNEIRQNDKARLDPIALACLLLGWGVNYNSWKHPDPNYPNAVVYQLTISRTRVGAKPIQSKARYGSTVERTTYEGIVWCPKTENGTWLARRNGKVYFTGNTMYKIDAIQKERHGIGVPVIKLPAGFSVADRKLAEDMGRNLRTNERAHIVVPFNWEVTFAKLEGQPVDCLKSIEHHDMKIKSNILAPFMDEANVNPDSLDVYYKATRYIASTVCDTFNHYVIPQLVDFNFSRGGYPKLRVRRIGEEEALRTLSFAVRNFVGANIIRPDDELEKFVRSELDLPPVDESTVRETETPQTPGSSGAGPSQAGAPKPPHVGPPKQAPKQQATAGKRNVGEDASGGSK